MSYICYECRSSIPYGQEVRLGDYFHHLQCAIAKAEVERRKYQDYLLGCKNVIGAGIGWRYRYRAFDKKEVCVVVSVLKKYPKHQLASADVVRGYLEVAKTDVIETGKISAPRPVAIAYEYDRTRMIRPAPGGVSIGHYRITAGTLGCLITEDFERFILSNNHVLANEGECSYGDPILQPGPADGGRLEHKIAELDQYVPISFGYAINHVDAAVARPLSPDYVAPEVLDVGVPAGTVDVMLGMRVVKSGRTTGLTRGEVVQIGWYGWVEYRRGRAFFGDQLVIAPGEFSRGGDSGSVVFVDDGTRRICGLLFAGSDVVSLTNPFLTVLSELKVSL